MKKQKILLIVLAGLLLITGLVVYRAIMSKKAEPLEVVEEEVELLPAADSSIVVTAAFKKSADNTVTIAVSGLGGKYSKVAYELTYESEGLIKGVNSGSKPIEVTGEESFERDVYLGTCSKNVCKPDGGVSAVTVVLEFTDTQGARSQFSKEYEI